MAAPPSRSEAVVTTDTAEDHIAADHEEEFDAVAQRSRGQKDLVPRDDEIERRQHIGAEDVENEYGEGGKAAKAIYR